MLRKTLYAVTGCLVAVCMLLVACQGQTATPTGGTTVTGQPTSTTTTVSTATTTATATTPTSNMVTLTLKKRDGTTMQKTVEKPKYGGTLTTYGSNPLYIDGVYGLNYPGPCKWTMEPLNEDKWIWGPSGTGDFEFMWNIMTPPFDAMGGGGLAESWEIVGTDTVVFHIRKGVYFHNKPPVNGREMNAYDVEFSLLRYWNAPKSYHYSGVPWSVYMESIKAIDKWTLEMKSKPGKILIPFTMVTGASYVYPREVIDKYGDMNDWKNVCGTGPYILMDFVANGSATYKKNPDYWMKDPMFPENRLPYVDQIKELYITDRSTILAAMRTGKIDQGGLSLWEDLQALLKTNPETKYKSYVAATATTIDMKLDNPALPWYDKRVRHAMFMAINHPEIKNSFYRGQAEILAWPVAPVSDIDIFGDMYTPLAKLPESTQKLFGYYPDEAKKLLTEAGYPKGFKAELICMEADVDLMSIVKADLVKVGIELDIQVKEPGAYNAIAYGRTFPNLIRGSIDCTVEFSYWPRLGAGVSQNFGNFKDPVIEAARVKADLAGLDQQALTRPMKEVFPYILDQAYKITLTSPYWYVVWHPWVKGYNGSIFCLQLNTYKGWVKYAWIDQNLKYKMTGQK